MSRFERTIYYAIIILLFICSIKSCSTVADLTGNYIELSKSYKDVRVKHEKDSSKIYSMKVNLENADRKIMALSIIKLKNPKEVVKIVYKTKIITEIPVTKPVMFDSSLYMKLPQQFKQTNKWFNIDGQITTKGSIKIDSLSTFGTFTYALGDTLRNGLFNRLFRKKDHVVRLHIDNPYMNVTNFENIYIRQEKKWYQTKGFNILIGATIGFGITKVIK